MPRSVLEHFRNGPWYERLLYFNMYFLLRRSMLIGGHEKLSSVFTNEYTVDSSTAKKYMKAMVQKSSNFRISKTRQEFISILQLSKYFSI